MKNIAIIPARSGSKGLKDKNIRLFNGKPLLAYTIEAAQLSKQFEEIHVSTDSREYADIALKWGASVPFLRSEELATDCAGSWDVVKAVLKQYEKIGKVFHTAALLQPTSPLRTAEHICGGYQLLEEKNGNAVLSVCEAEHSPLWCNTLDIDGSMKGFAANEISKTPRQKLDTYYRLNGALYIQKTDYLNKGGALYAEGCYAYIMPAECSIDIDKELDFRMAEFLMRILN